MKKYLAPVLAFALLFTSDAYAASTINPNNPVANSPLTSAPIRNNFAAAYNDVNNVLSKFGNLTAPSNPTTLQDWINTSNNPYIWNVYDGTQWVAIGTLNTSTHIFTPSNASGCSFANPTAIIGSSPVNGTATTCMRSDAAPPLPATLPALNGSNLTNLNTLALNATGTPSSSTYLRGDNTWATVTGGVSSVFGRSGAVVATSGDYGVAQVTGAAPLASPTFTGTVTIPNGGVFGIPTSITLTNATGLVPSTGLSATGTPSSTTYLRGDNSWQALPAAPAGANPTATIGASAVNGVATTFMRSDAAPALPSTLPALNGSLLTGMTVGQISGAAPLASPTFTGTVTIPNGGVFGTPTSLTLTNAVGLPLTTGVTGILPAANGGNGNGFFAVSGPATTTKTFTFPNASANVLTDNAAVTVAQGGTGIASGTSGGVPYYSGTTSIASSALLTNHALMLGGGAAAAPKVVGSLGTSTTLLHGAAAGDPTFSAVDLNADVTGNLGVTHLNSGTSASSTTFWRGDGVWATPSGAGTVTSVGQTFTGGLISVSGSPITGSGTLALTVAGTSGGIPYFSSASTWASSAALTANAIVLGGGAGAAPAPLGSLGTTTTLLHGNAAGAPTFGAVSLTADVSGILPSANGGAGSVSGIMQANGSGLTAAATLGNGLLYSSPKLSLTNTLNAQSGTSYAVASTDAGSIVTGTNASAQAYTIVVASTAGFTAGYGTTLANIGTLGSSGNITLTATTSLFGNKLTTLVVSPGQVADIGSDGTNYPFTAMSLPVMAQDTILGNPNAANYPTAMTVPSCASDGAHALTYAAHALACSVNTGTVSSVAASFTGGLLSVSGSPITSSGTLAWTVAGTSGGIPYFSSASTWASSAALTNHAIVLGGGAGAAPTVLGSLGTSTTVLHGAAAGNPTFSAIDLTADVTGILPAANGGAGTLNGILRANGSGLVSVATTAAQTNLANNWTALQSNCITTLTAVSNVFTPDGTCNNYKLVLGATNTLANWSAGMTAGAAGTIEIDQDGTGSRTISTYGSQLIAPGGTATITLSTAASAKDLLSYLVLDSTHVWLAVGGLNASH